MEPNLMRSGRWQFNALDFQKWSKNTLIFLSPAMVVFLLQLQNGKTPQEAFVALQVWLLGIVIDFLRKFSASN